MPFDFSVGSVVLIAGFPLLLLLLLLLLERIESWMLTPDERAAAVSHLLEQVDEAEELEQAVALMMSEVADRPTAPHQSAASRTRAWRLVRRRRA